MRAPTVLVAGACFVLAACSRGGEGGAPRQAQTPVPAQASTQHPSAAAPAPVRASDRPFEQYSTPGQDGMAWVALYYASSGTPADAAAVAARLDPKFQATSDAFARRDLVNDVQRRLDAGIAGYKANPYVELPPVVARMPAYDVNQGRYDLSSLLGPGVGLTVADGNARVAFVGNPGLTGYAPANESEARALEHEIADNPLGRQIQITIYGKVTGADALGGTPRLSVTPTRAVVVNYFADGHTEPLFTATTTP